MNSSKKENQDLDAFETYIEARDNYTWKTGLWKAAKLLGFLALGVWAWRNVRPLAAVTWVYLGLGWKLAVLTPYQMRHPFFWVTVVFYPILLVADLVRSELKMRKN